LSKSFLISLRLPSVKSHLLMGSVRSTGSVNRRSGTVLVESVANKLSRSIHVLAHFILFSQELIEPISHVYNAFDFVLIY
jgi:hypothetical protein